MGSTTTPAELERIQIRILARISTLEESYSPRLGLLPNNHPTADADADADSVPSLSERFSTSLALTPPSVDDTVSRLSEILRGSGVKDFRFVRAPRDYYDRSFEERRQILGAHSIDHLCKSIVMVCSSFLMIVSLSIELAMILKFD